MARALAAGDVPWATVRAAFRQHRARLEPQVRALSAWHDEADPAGPWSAVPSGPLAGVPVAVKDIIDTHDLPTAFGSTVAEGRRPARDAVCVARLRQAGLVVAAKAVPAEFATGQPGPTRNPWDLARTPGGSSSGSAAAVAAGMFPVAVGTQTSGSVLRPASFCGVVGFKPTYGRIPLDGVHPLAPSLDTVGALARSVDDAVAVVNVMAGGAPAVRLSDVTPRIAWSYTPWWDQVDPGVRRVLEKELTWLRPQVCTRPDRRLPAHLRELTDVQQILLAVERLESLASWREASTPQAGLSPMLSEQLERDEAVSAEERDWAYERLHRARAIPDPIWSEIDVLLTPATLGEAPLGIDDDGDPLPCRTWTTVGSPSCSIPLTTGPTGLPIGLQLVAAPGNDALLIHVARDLEARIAWDG